jgi:hypothetical protein
MEKFSILCPSAAARTVAASIPATMETFSSQRDGTLTIIKENSPTSFEVEQNVQTKQGAKTCTLDTKNNQIVLITTERPATTSAGGSRDRRSGNSAGSHKPARWRRPARSRRQ